MPENTPHPPEPVPNTPPTPGPDLPPPPDPPANPDLPDEFPGRPSTTPPLPDPTRAALRLNAGLISVRVLHPSFQNWSGLNCNTPPTH
jgi:hypothetical protein